MYQMPDEVAQTLKVNQLWSSINKRKEHSKESNRKPAKRNRKKLINNRKRNKRAPRLSKTKAFIQEMLKISKLKVVLPSKTRLLLARNNSNNNKNLTMEWILRNLGIYMIWILHNSRYLITFLTNMLRLPEDFLNPENAECPVHHNLTLHFLLN